MGFVLFLFALLCPGLMIFTGWLMWKHPPKNINSLYGYRTTRSSKSPQAWRFAQEYAGKLWWKLGWWSLGLTVLASLPFLRGTETSLSIAVTVLVLAQCVLMVVSIFPVEQALKRQFDDNGLPRQSKTAG